MTPAVAFMIVVGLGQAKGLLLPNCSPDHGDCSCNDKAFQGCQEPTAENEEVVENLEECLAKCDEFSAAGVCEWLIYHPTGDCLMFGTASESMEEYLDSCNRVGLPTRREDGSCLADLVGCNPIICPPTSDHEGCQPCDLDSVCNMNFHQTECSMITSSEENSFAPKDFSGCQAFCTTMGVSSPITYLTWSKAEGDCSCFASGCQAWIFNRRHCFLHHLSILAEN